MEMRQIFEILDEMRADRIADRECMKQMMARTDDNRERDLDDLKGMIFKMSAKMDAHHKKMMAMLDALHEMDDGLYWKHGGRYREDCTRSRNDAEHRGTFKDPQGRIRSDAGRRTEEAA
jgi:hypothetical protein